MGRRRARSSLLARPERRRLRLRVLVVGRDDPLHELVPHHVLAAEAHEADALDAGQDVADHDETGAAAAVEVDLGDVARHDHLRVEAKPRKEHLHLLGGRVLRLVEDDEAVVQGPAAHEGEWRDLDRAALEVLVHALGLEHVVERVEERPQVGVDLGHHVARQEAEPLAGLDGRAREHDAVHLAALERRHRARDREERLAGARRADADGDRLLPDRVDVRLLIDGLRRDLEAAVAPDHVLEDLRRRLVVLERAGHGLDRARRDLVALAHEIGDLAHDGRRHLHLALSAVEREHVSAQEDVAVELALQGLHDHVARAGELGGDVVRQFELSPQSPGPPLEPGAAGRVSGMATSFSLTIALTRLPSARPCTRGIACDMTWPISLGDDAPVSAITSPTIAWISSSDSCAGRYASIRAASASSPSARSSRAASRYASAASSRRLRSRWSTATSSASLPAAASLWAFCSSELTSLSAPTRSRSPDFMAAVMSDLTRSRSVTASSVGRASGLAGHASRATTRVWKPFVFVSSIEKPTDRTIDSIALGLSPHHQLPKPSASSNGVVRPSRLGSG